MHVLAENGKVLLFHEPLILQTLAVLSIVLLALKLRRDLLRFLNDLSALPLQVGETLIIKEGFPQLQETHIIIVPEAPSVLRLSDLLEGVGDLVLDVQREILFHEVLKAEELVAEVVHDCVHLVEHLLMLVILNFELCERHLILVNLLNLRLLPVLRERHFL